MPTSNSCNIIQTPGGAFEEYTESTWTPIIIGSTLTGVGTYTTQVGLYVRLGNMVYISGVVIWTAHTGTGNMLVDGLPFTVRNTASYIPQCLLGFSNISTPGGIVDTGAQFTLNTTQIEMIGLRNNNPINNFAMEPAGEVRVSGWYLV